MSKTVRSLISILVALSMLFSFSASALDTTANTPNETAIFNVVADFFESIFAKLYEQNQGAAGAGPDMGGAGFGADMGGQSGSYDDDIIDGDYREV